MKVILEQETGTNTQVSKPIQRITEADNHVTCCSTKIQFRGESSSNQCWSALIISVSFSDTTGTGVHQQFPSLLSVYCQESLSDYTGVVVIKFSMTISNSGILLISQHIYDVIIEFQTHCFSMKLGVYCHVSSSLVIFFSFIFTLLHDNNNHWASIMFPALYQ